MSRLDDTSETIVAVATPPGSAPRGVVRLSGPNAWSAVAGLLADPAPTNPRSGEMRPARLSIQGIHRPVPANLLFWNGATGFTGQPAVEIHTWGNPPLLQAILQTLAARGARLARPGEFALRAFLAGKIDLLQAEAIVGLIDAGDRHEFSLALTQLAGGIAGPLQRIRDDLIDVLALVEAGLDFVDEDIEFVSGDELRSRIAEVERRVAALLEQIQTRAAPETLPTVALIGRPNAGKSSLFNALIEQDSAIVAPVAGTTRDYLRATLEVGGHVVLLVDTAGYEPKSATIDRVDIDRLAAVKSAGQAEQAALRLICIDATTCADSPSEFGDFWTRDSGIDDRVIVLTKCDRAGRGDWPADCIPTSSWTGYGITDLRRAIADKIAVRWAAARDVIPATAIRCAEALDQVAEALRAAQLSLAENAGGELVASDLRVALEHLGQIVGAIYNDDVLDRIFSRFCIGK